MPAGYRRAADQDADGSRDGAGIGDAVGEGRRSSPTPPLNASPPPTQMPLFAAEIVPELAMPPEKVESMTVALSSVPPTQMPFAPDAIVPNWRCRRGRLRA